MPCNQSDRPQKSVSEPQTADSDAPLLKRIYHGWLRILQKFRLLAIVGLVIYLFLESSVFVTQPGEICFYNNLLSMKTEIGEEPGFRLKIPFSKVTGYQRSGMVDFGNDYAASKSDRKTAPMTLRFQDGYTITIPVTFHYQLPEDEKHRQKIYWNFPTHENLVNTLLIPIFYDVMVNTATRYTGERFFGNGLNDFKAAVEDQLDPDLSQKPSENKPTAEKTPAYIHLDYGIEIKQVTFGVPLPGDDLRRWLDNQIEKKLENTNDKAK